MKHIFLMASAFLVLFFLTNCASVSSSEAQILQRQWMLVSMDNHSKADFVKNKAEINLTGKITDGKIKGTAFMGCNSMFFTAKVKPGQKIEISNIGSTMMACQNNRLERDFIQNFSKMHSYKIKGHFLILSDEKGNKMEFVAADWD